MLLEHLADAAGGSVTLSDLAEATALPMPTVHRLLRFLTSQGYARQETSKRYALGLRMIRLGQAASRGLGSWAIPYLAKLVDKYGETSNLAMLEGDNCIYVSQVPSPQSMRMFTEVGRVGDAALHRRRQSDPLAPTRPTSSRPTRPHRHAGTYRTHLDDHGRNAHRTQISTAPGLCPRRWRTGTRSPLRRHPA